MKIRATVDIQSLILKDYENYTRILVKDIFKSEQVCSIYQLGGWSQPGISDIDLIVVTENIGSKVLDLSKENLCANKKQSYMLMHPPFVISRDVFHYLDVFFYCSDLRLLKGESLDIKTLSSNFKQDVEYYKILSFLSHTYPRFNGFNDNISLRGFLTFAYSLKHTYYILQELNKEYKDLKIENYIRAITDLRKSSLEIPESEKFIYIDDLVKDGQKTCRSMMEELQRQILKEYSFDFTSTKNIYYLKNHSNIFQFSNDFKDINSKQTQKINVTQLPLIFAVFTLLPFDKNNSFSEFQSRFTYGHLNINMPEKLYTNLKEIKELYNQYQKSYVKAKVINGMPFELNTTMIWQFRFLKKFRLKDNYIALKSKVRLLETKCVIKKLSN